MTNEEFTGHLLDSLHGPKAAEIVARIVKVATDVVRDEPQAFSLAILALGENLHDLLLADHEQLVWLLCSIALAEEDKASRRDQTLDDARETLKIVTRLHAARATLRDKTRELLGKLGAGEESDVVRRFMGFEA